MSATIVLPAFDEAETLPALLTAMETRRLAMRQHHGRRMGSDGVGIGR